MPNPALWCYRAMKAVFFCVEYFYSTLSLKMDNWGGNARRK
jgi:hypothetical protein